MPSDTRAEILTQEGYRENAKQIAEGFRALL
jgi:hypothetical protein